MPRDNRARVAESEPSIAEMMSREANPSRN